MIIINKNANDDDYDVVDVVVATVSNIVANNLQHYLTTIAIVDITIGQ